MYVEFKPNIRYSKNSTSLISDEDFMYVNFVNIKNRIPYTGNYSEMILYIKNNILKLLSSAVDKKPKALKIITDKEFLIAMDISNISLTKEYINRFNRVYRAYTINPSKNVIYNQTSANLLYKIALKLNIEYVNIFMNLGLFQDEALWITVNRYSSTDERRNIHRMVRAMQHMNPIRMTKEMATSIFANTFNNQLSNLFISIMTDRFDMFDSEDEKYVYSTISNTILDILNSIAEEEIMDILIEYTDELHKSGVSGRFSLKSINSSDYGSICKVINELEFRGIKID